ncbi:MAG: hypothetical protein WC924_00585 [Candidatus Gracilibacteria bacterium]
MKKLLTILLLLLMNGCADDSLHVDLQNELNVRPTVSLTLEDGTQIAGFPWSYCTDIVCFDKEPIDFSALTYTPYINGTDLTFTVTFTDEISSLSIKTYNKNGEATHRELPYTVIDDHTFLFEEPFPTDETEIALNIKVDFVNEGLAHYYFPLKLE